MACMHRSSLPVIFLAAAMFACSPVLDWREVRPEGSGVVLLFPCKPASHVRVTSLSGLPTPMTLVSCQTAGLTFALSHADLVDPARVTTTLAEMRSVLAVNLGAEATQPVAFEVAGMTPNAQAIRFRLDGRAPDGAPIEAVAALFARGTRVFQAVVLGNHVDEGAAGVFLDSLRLRS